MLQRVENAHWGFRTLSMTKHSGYELSKRQDSRYTTQTKTRTSVTRNSESGDVLARRPQGVFWQDINSSIGPIRTSQGRFNYGSSFVKRKKDALMLKGKIKKNRKFRLLRQAFGKDDMLRSNWKYGNDSFITHLARPSPIKSLYRWGHCSSRFCSFLHSIYNCRSCATLLMSRSGFLSSLLLLYLCLF